MATKRGRKPAKKKEKIEIDEKNAIIIEERQSEDDDKTSPRPVEAETEKIELQAEEIAPPVFRNPLERNLGYGFSSLEFTIPDLEAYWASEQDIPKFLQWGYQYCKQAWVKDYELIYNNLLPGQGSNPNGMVTRDGHTLLVASKEIAQAKRNASLNKIQNPRKSSTFGMSEREMAEKNIT